MTGRLDGLEEKKYVLWGPFKHELSTELTAMKKEVTTAVSDWKGFALEIAAAKIAWDIIKLELPSVLKVNEEKLLERLSLRYKDAGPGGLFQRLERIPPERPAQTGTQDPAQPAPGSATTTSANRTAATNGTAAARTATPAPAGSPTRPRTPAPAALPTTNDTRTAIAGAQGVANATNSAETSSGRLERTLAG
ncbi:hypothetical protein [Streptomyces brasiliscabiei]|uniref:Uncharacterized protein n=1 Tax=Streptomyces brasiliscabiei TaxID=2736302 RepID=A0ABU8GM34_9ACTN